MFEEHSLHAPFRNGADLGVIWRIEVQKRQRSRLRNGVESIALDGLNAAFGIKFYAIAPDGSVPGH
jgi:hypothetical protein